MKFTRLMSLKYGLLLCVMIICFGSCGSGKKVPFNASTVQPAAKGNVKVKKDKNSNYHIDVDVTNLADPKKLTPSKKVYVVWIETKENGTKSIGQLHSGSGMFSKT